MRLLLHIGLHKTGSTYLQGLLNTNRTALAAKGIHYRGTADNFAHHLESWNSLKGDFIWLEKQAHDARVSGCDTVLISSEEFETLLYRAGLARQLEAEARAAGFSEIEWHACLREPGAYYGSLFSELLKYIAVDSDALYAEIMATGAYCARLEAYPRMPQRHWDFCFDAMTGFARLAGAVSGPLYLHDFHEMSLFPGWTILRQIEALDALAVRPNDSWQNARWSRERIVDRLMFWHARGQGADGCPPVDGPEDARVRFEAAYDRIPAHAADIQSRFGDAFLAALDRWPCQPF